MRKFLYSLLGTVAGIWISAFIGVALLLLIMGVAVASGTSQKPISVSDDSVLQIDLSGTIVDRATSANLMDQIYGQAETTISLSDIVDAIQAAKDDSRIDGVLLKCGNLSVGTAQAQAIIAALQDFKESGKWVYSYADTYTQGAYYIASVSDSLFLNPIGMIDIHGLSSTTIYFKDLLSKIGVEAQVVKVGTYKSAVEPYILSGMSDANREQQQYFLGNIWGFMKESIAKNRKVSPDSVNSWAESYVFAKNADYYKAKGIIDATKYEHQLFDDIATVTGKSEKPDMITVADYIAVAESPLKKANKNALNIAVLYAQGEITESADDGITSERLVPEILKLAKNESIDGLILRVNSGGGSAYASEQIWEALEQFKAISGKPFYVSMSDMAASGGYYISCGAKKIYAEPTTLTGSIGIFGIIPNIQPLLKDKLGVNTYTVSTGQGAMPSIMEPMTQSQRDAMQAYVNNGYELFVKRCAEGRGKSIDEIKAVAEGRVWDGQSALNHGLVDKLGGLDVALSDMAAELGEDIYYVTEYPAVKTKWWEMLISMDQELNAAVNASEFATASYCINALKNVKNISPLQCRADYIKLH